MLWQFVQKFGSASFIFVPFSPGSSIIVTDGACMLWGLTIEEKRESAQTWRVGGRMLWSEMHTRGEMTSGDLEVAVPKRLHIGGGAAWRPFSRKAV